MGMSRLLLSPDTVERLPAHRISEMEKHLIKGDWGICHKHTRNHCTLLNTLKPVMCTRERFPCFVAFPFQRAVLDLLLPRHGCPAGRIMRTLTAYSQRLVLEGGCLFRLRFQSHIQLMASLSVLAEICAP